ncbi:MAG: GNAT family N-acetyltransferase [Mycobacterium sp.]
MAVQVTDAFAADAEELAEVAAATFPLACPPSVPADDVAAFIIANLSAQRFAAYLADPDRRVLALREVGRIIGYTVLIRPAGTLEVELSKFYLLAGHHGSGAAAALMQAALDWAAESGAQRIWLGVNRNNERAQGFYRKQGFEVTGTRTFELGAGIEQDFVMARSL